MAFMKSLPPRFRGTETIPEKVEAVLVYLTKLCEELDYVTRHIGGGNINGTALEIRVMSADGNTELGKVGALGSGVGLASGAASVCVTGAGVVLMCGSAGLRVTESGAEKTTDGKTWTAI